MSLGKQAKTLTKPQQEAVLAYLTSRRLFDVVRDDVMASTGQKQQPFSYGSVSGSLDFYFVQK